MDIKIQVTKKKLFRLALFVAVIGIAALLDSYFDKNPVQLEKVDAGANGQQDDTNSIHLLSQLNIPTLKVELQKPTFKEIQPKLHDRFIQKYHQLRNHQVLKAEVEPKTSPLISVYHYLAFKNHYFSDPDADYPLAL